MVASAKPAMTVEAQKEIEDFFRNMRQAFNSRDIKAYRAHFWTDKRFVHFDSSGRIDVGWGAYEEFLDQEFRYMDLIKLDLKELQIQVFEDQFSSVTGQWRTTQVDPEGREHVQEGRVTFAVVRLGDAWKIVNPHYSPTSGGD
jgi:ketosteroid isomerase-like protein